MPVAKLKIVVSMIVNGKVVDGRRIDIELDESDINRKFTWHTTDVTARDHDAGHKITVTGRTEVELMELEADVAVEAQA